MAKRSEEFNHFDAAMYAILRADPKAVKEEMEREKQANAEKRKAKKNDGPDKNDDPAK